MKFFVTEDTKKPEGLEGYWGLRDLETKGLRERET